MDIDRIIGLYLRGEASEKELQALQQWMSTSEKNVRSIRNLEKAWSLKPEKRIFLNEHEVSDRVWIRLQNENRRGKLSNLPVIYQTAAVFALIATFSFLLWLILTKQEKISPATAETSITKSNPAGTKSTIRLPDGSTVILNAESTLNYSFNGNDSIRLLELTGEAYFQVQKDPRRPFIVKSGNTYTRALGTEFNIKAYPDEETIDIALTKGAVLVGVKSLQVHSEFQLEPGEGVVYDKKADSAQKTTFNPKEKIAWKDGIIYFDKDNLQEVIKKLSRWYGVDFTIRNYDGEPWHYSGEFSNEYLDVVLQSMSYSKHFNFEITNGKVIIEFKPKKQSTMEE